MVEKIVSNKITKSQFGFKHDSDCNMAKIMIYYKSKKHKLNKALLIDIKKAYDSVSRNKLKEIISTTFIEAEAKFLNYFINLYESLKIN